MPASGSRADSEATTVLLHAEDINIEVEDAQFQSPDTDRPTRLRAFRRNVRQCKIALVPSLAAALATGVAHLVVLPFPFVDALGRRNGSWLATAVWSVEAIILVLTLVSTALLIASLIRRPFPAALRPADLGEPMNLGYHRVACMGIFLLGLFSIILHAAPGFIYTIVTKRGTPPRPSVTNLLSTLHVASLVAVLVSSGCMRRGPRLRAREPSLGTSFGTTSDAKPSSSNDLDDAGLEVIDYSNCSMLTFLTLGYSIALARRSHEVDHLVQTDLPMLEEWVRTSGNGYLAEQEPMGGDFQPYTSFGLVKSLWSGRGWAVFLTFLLETLNTLVSFIGVAALHELIASFGKSEDHSYEYLMCWGLFLGQAIEVLLSAYLWVRENYLLHNPVRMTLSAILYAKILRSTDAKAMEAQHLTSEADAKANKGRAQVMNLLTIDVNTVSSLATYIWNITNGLVRLWIGMVFLYQMLGFSAAMGLLCVPLVTPVSIWVAKKIYECDRAWARERDARTGAIKEFLAGIKVIKLNAFEDYETRRIGALRDVETSWQRWRYTLGTLFNILAEEMPNVAILVTFVFYTKVMGNVLEPATAFVAMTVFYRVKSGLDMLPNSVDIVLNTKISLDRLKGYLNQPEVEVNPADVSDGMIVLDDATFSWPRAEKAEEEDAIPAFQMRHYSISLPQDKLTLVCGPLGSGKTLFLRALLGEAKVDEGHIIAPRSAPDTTPLDSSLIKFRWTNELWLDNCVAYAPQNSYIRHGTVRDNIVFGQPFWQERYVEVIRQCSLESDLALLADGDMTEVGEHGANLSGGQKARINLARCMYSRARTIYLDDVLSAVDAHTAQYIVDQCFRGPLAKGRTVVLVSHHVDLCLPAASYVVAIAADGSLQQACRASEAGVGSLLALASPVQAKKDVATSPVSTMTALPAHQQQPDAADVLDTYAELNELASPPDPTDPAYIYEEVEPETESQAADDRRVLYRAEHQSTGHVSTSHYWMMIRAAGGWWYWLIFAFIFLAAKGTQVFVSWVLEWWTADPDPSMLDHYLFLYVVANLTTSVFGAFRWVWLYGIGNVGWYSSGTKKIHRRLFATIANAPLSFFETTPAGRLLNVFAQDMRRIDSQSADDFGRTTMELLRLVAAAGIVGFEEPSLMIILVIFGVPLIMVANGLGRLRTNLRRLAAVADSPLISLYHDSVDGVVMLRAFGMPNVMAQAMKALINRSRTAETWNWICFNWVRAVVLTLSSVFVTSTGFMLVGRDMSPSKAGFILSFAVQISGFLYGLLETFILLEQTFVSAERISYYIQDTPQEPTGGVVPQPQWPEHGAISVRDLSVRYAPDLPDVLKNVSFDIRAGESVGLVGATGSGKSTLALSLFRAMEAHTGSLSIDGLDIASVSLRALRSRLNMVAQDGSLPSGTLRNALDVSGERDDPEIYDALRRVHLLPEIITEDDVKTNPFANLDTFVAAEGSNFSHGQKQLLCLARALLKRSRILVLDEATSSVDFDTDAKITATIRECFAHTTMLVIAHRLATIVAYDRVLVMERGQVLENDSPLTLMQREGSSFRALCLAQGADEFGRLLALAERAQ